WQLYLATGIPALQEAARKGRKAANVSQKMHKSSEAASISAAPRKTNATHCRGKRQPVAPDSDIPSIAGGAPFFRSIDEAVSVPARQLNDQRPSMAVPVPATLSAHGPHGGVPGAKRSVPQNSEV